MDLGHIDKLIAKAKSRESVYVAGGAEVAAIRQVENELGISFCSDYVEFLSKYGMIGVVDEHLFGLHMKYFSDKSGGDVRFETRRFTSETGLTLENKTVLLNIDGEGYLLIDHANGAVLSYDPLAKMFHSYAPNLEGAIEKFFETYS